jgi:hypothetical protein
MRLDFLLFDAGGGHRAAATALKAVIEQQRRPWQVNLVDVNEILAPIDIFRKLTGLGLEDLYNTLLKKGWTLGMRQMLPLMHGVIRLYHSRQVWLLEEYWRSGPPDMAVSLIPNFNRAILEALRRCTKTAPFVTILTDMADYPPHFWIERQPQYLICGTERAVEQAREFGHPQERVFRTSGMILRPEFYDTSDLDRDEERLRLGLKPDVPTGLILFGGQGSPVMLDLARRLSRVSRPLQLILICGHNDRLAARLRAAPGKIPMRVEGFTKEIPRLMRISDFFIGKPGPGSISEAVAMGLPVIIERNAWTMPQERFNAEWVQEKGVGIVLRSFREIASAVEELLEPGALETYRARAAAIQNRAVFEIPCILEKIARLPAPA